MTDRSIETGRVTVTLLVFVTVLFGLSVRGGSLASFAAVPATIALFPVVMKLRSTDHRVAAHDVDLRLFVGLVVFVILALGGWAPSLFGPTNTVLEVLPPITWGLLGGTVFFVSVERSRSFKVAVVLISLAFTAVVGVAHIITSEGVGIDVLFLHKSAAEAMAAGQNPYTDAVSVPDGAPTAEPGDMIEGYVYPPVTAVAYALGEWAFSDPRYTSLAAWLIFLGLIGIESVRRPTKTVMLIFLLMASIPGWPMVLRAAWTEPLSLAFAGATFYLWKRPAGSGASLGLMLASKQYFFVTAPLIALFRDRGWLRRAIWAGVVVLATVGVAVLFDPIAFWKSAVAFHTSTPTRFDSVNLIGLLASLDYEWSPPSLLPILVGLVTATWAGLRSTRPHEFFSAAALTLAASFMFSSQAFANYWFLVTGLCGLALISKVPHLDESAA